MVISGDFIPETGAPTVSAINVGTLKATTSHADKYCMLDSGADVMVVPSVEGMEGSRGWIIRHQVLLYPRLYTESRTYLWWP